MVSFIILSRGLPKLMLLWVQTDKIMNRVYGFPRNYNIRFIAFSVSYLIFAIRKDNDFFYIQLCSFFLICSRNHHRYIYAYVWF